MNNKHSQFAVKVLHVLESFGDKETMDQGRWTRAQNAAKNIMKFWNGCGVVAKQHLYLGRNWQTSCLCPRGNCTSCWGLHRLWRIPNMLQVPATQMASSNFWNTAPMKTLVSFQLQFLSSNKLTCRGFLCLVSWVWPRLGLCCLGFTVAFGASSTSSSFASMSIDPACLSLALLSTHTFQKYCRLLIWIFCVFVCRMPSQDLRSLFFLKRKPLQINLFVEKDSQAFQRYSF